jgi:hypothetical protein
MRPNRICASNQFIQRAIRVIFGKPDSLAIVWVATPVVVLFLARVYYWNSVSHNGEHCYILCKRNVIRIPEIR